VCDAGRQLSKSAQFVGAGGAGLGQLLLGNVAHENHHAGDAAIAPQGRGVRVHAAHAAVGTNGAHFELFLFTTESALHRRVGFFLRFSRDDHAKVLAEQN